MNTELGVFVTLIALSAANIPWRGQPWPGWRGGVGINRRYGVNAMAYGINAMRNSYGARGYGARGYGARGFATRDYSSWNNAARGYNFDGGVSFRGSYNNYYSNNNYRSRYNNNGYRMRYSSESDYYDRFYDNNFVDEDNYDDDDDDDDYNRYMTFHGRYGQPFYGNYRKDLSARKRPTFKATLNYKTPFVMKKKIVPKWRPRIQSQKWWPQIRSPKWQPQIKSPKWRPYRYLI